VFLLLAQQRRRATALGRLLGETNEALHAAVHDSLSGLKLAKILGNESHHKLRLARHMAQTQQQHEDFQRGSSLSRAALQIGGAVLLSIYLYIGLSVWLVPVAKLLTLVVIFARMIPQLSGALQQLHHCLHALPALDTARSLLDECEKAAEPVAPTGMTPMVVTQHIALDQITLRHAGRDTPALADLSLVLRARTTTAVMGESGAGKSTLADVLTGLLVPDSGTLRIDGSRIEGPARIAWRHSVSYVPQEVTLFHDTIRSNLLWGCAGASDAALAGALQRAAADFVFRLPLGLETVIGDQGIRLSGGERQRLALARALLRQPALLILDEATSALDRDNELRIREAIENLHGDLTVLIIGHRLSTLHHADQVIVLEQGRIRSQGKWADVLQHTGVTQ
jgi:ATP-binding cassette subfamily C protein